ncbi:hypothetical protein EJD97_005098 [Solanum chilense]|uniref:Uncharacterized protein n=1 Tax=Solanum chilense TaxID=4083 RepID=A0A6N2AJN4_SOLCI|nr:hypothetical protein EJD97_005098 [Solanum chilense]
MERGFGCEICDSVVFPRVVKRTGWGFSGQILLFICRLLDWQRGWSGVLLSCCVVVGRSYVGCGLVLWFIEGGSPHGVVILGLIGALNSFSYRVSLKLGTYL